MPVIEKLSHETILKIAAGEVIERPACVVKELIENSIDAGATDIVLNIKDDGLGLIEVKDNGQGIEPDDMNLAFESHATSKLKKEEDLGTLLTRGFRGEALASISAISQIEVLTKSITSKHGSLYEFENGHKTFEEPAPREAGTTMRIKNLFYNTPTRKKFLKSMITERSHIEKTFKKLSISEWNKRFELNINGQNTFLLQKAKSLLERVGDLFGHHIASNMLEIDYVTPAIKASGLVSNKNLSFSKPSEMYFFVNRRFIQDRTIQAGVMEGYRSALMEHRFPMVFLFIDVDPFLVDVNIHPRKYEVRFVNAQEVFKAVSKSIFQALTSQTSHKNNFLQSSDHAVRTWQQPKNVHTQSVQHFDVQSVLFKGSHAVIEPVQEKQTFFFNMHHVHTIDDTYLVMQAGLKLYIIDQHAAHERVLFEQFKNKALGQNASQHLLYPISVSLSPTQTKALTINLDLLNSMGFEIDLIGPNQFSIRSLPLNIHSHVTPTLFTQMIDELIDDFNCSSWSDLQDDFYARLACHSAIRAHDRMNQQEIDFLLKSMDHTQLSAYCPHGRPTHFELNVDLLEKLFERK